MSVGLSAKDALLLHVSGGLSSMGGARMCCIRPSFGIGIFNFVLNFITGDDILWVVLFVSSSSFLTVAVNDVLRPPR